ncbi:hypothetical protein O0L34_g4170 [Tuta absoluta]|nr:hypothetical protein O0L34_g4170 [Tuta absoluta]
MSTTINLLLLVIPLILQCVNMKTNHNATQKPGKLCESSAVQIKTTNSLVQAANLKPFSCHNDFIWKRLDNLKQWKRRRRFIANSVKSFRKLRSKRRAINAVDSRSLVYRSASYRGKESSEELMARFKERWPVAQWRSFGFFSDEYLLMINQHWLSFPPPDPRHQYALGGLYVAMMVVGCTGNALVLLMYLRSVQ